MGQPRLINILPADWWAQNNYFQCQWVGPVLTSLWEWVSPHQFIHCLGTGWVIAGPITTNIHVQWDSPGSLINDLYNRWLCTLNCNPSGLAHKYQYLWGVGDAGSLINCIGHQMACINFPFLMARLTKTSIYWDMVTQQNQSIAFQFVEPRLIIT
jgi:hypothetical protein